MNHCSQRPGMSWNMTSPRMYTHPERSDNTLVFKGTEKLLSEVFSAQRVGGTQQALRLQSTWLSLHSRHSDLFTNMTALSPANPSSNAHAYFFSSRVKLQVHQVDLWSRHQLGSSLGGSNEQRRRDRRNFESFASTHHRQYARRHGAIIVSTVTITHGARILLSITRLGPGYRSLR